MKYLFVGGPRDGERVEIEGEPPRFDGEYRKWLHGDAYIHTKSFPVITQAIAQLIERYPEPEKRDLSAEAFIAKKVTVLESKPDNLFTASCGCVMDVNKSSSLLENIVKPCEYFNSLRPWPGSRPAFDHYDLVSVEWRESQQSKSLGVDVPSSEGVDAEPITIRGVPIVWKEGLGSDDPADDDFDMEQFAKDVGSPVIEIEPSVVELPPLVATKESGKDSEVEMVWYHWKDGVGFVPVATCPDCKGKGVVELFNTVEPCKTCGGGE